MAVSTTLPILAGLSLLGSALGVHLGRSAVAEIAPVSAEPKTAFHSDLVPNRSRRGAQPLAAPSEVAITSCVGCRTYPEEYRPVHDPAVDGYEDGWAASASYSPAPAYEEAAVPAEAPADPEREAIVRYASYQVAGEPEPAPALAEAD
jgi:hypothetical protein